jgi:DNA-binding transcriptional LysR family regulator
MGFQDLDIDLLRCFVAVAEAKGFTAAGKIVGRTQSAISVKIQRLEHLLHRQFLKRTSRSLALTEEGETLTRVRATHIGSS